MGVQDHLLVEVGVEGNLLHVLGLAQFHECFPSSVVGVEHLQKKRDSIGEMNEVKFERRKYFEGRLERYNLSVGFNSAEASGIVAWPIAWVSTFCRMSSTR